REGVEAHSAVESPVEERRMIAMLAEYASQTVQIVVLVHTVDVRLVHKRRNTRQNSRQRFDGSSAVGVAMREKKRLPGQTIQKRSIFLMIGTRSHVLPAKAFQYDNDYIVLY